MNIRSLTILLCLFSLTVKAQDDEHLFSQLFNGIFISPDNAENLEEVYQQLYHFYQHPINLNKATADDLRALLILDDLQIHEIMKHRKSTGKFISVYELQAVPLLSLQDLKNLSYFVTVNEITMAGETNDFLILRYERDLERRKGYKESTETPGITPYLGTQDKLLFRMKHSLGSNISYGILIEKDAGENIIWDPSSKRYGLDHYSGYVLYTGAGKLEKLILGDYHLQFGQGLVYSSGFALGKSAGEIAGFRRITTGIRPHSSTLESGFLRGMAATIRHRELKATGFVSLNNNDATLDEEKNIFSGFNHSGFHRTRTEVQRKDDLQERQAGLFLQYEKGGFSGGIGASTIRLSSIWEPVERHYNARAFSGAALNNTFGYINYSWRNINIFNESSFLQKGGFATIGGALVNLTTSMQTGFIYRNYSSGFASLYGNAIGEKSSNTNEKGILWVTNLSLKKKLQFSFYFDRFIFPWLSYQISQPSEGYEYLIRLRYNLSKHSYMLLQYKEEEKGKDVEVGKVNQVIKNRKKNYQFLIAFPASDQLDFRTRIQGSHTSFTGGEGIAMLQDVSWSGSKYKLTFRYAMFDVTDFGNSQYVYENDVLYAFSFPALQGKGNRFYLLFKYNLSKKFKIWGRYSQTTYTDRQQISSGNELIDGNRLREIKMQVFYKL